MAAVPELLTPPLQDGPDEPSPLAQERPGTEVAIPDPARGSTKREQVRAAMQEHMPEFLAFCDEWREIDPGMRIVYLDIPAAGIHLETRDYVPPPEPGESAWEEFTPPEDPIEMAYRLKHWKR